MNGVYNLYMRINQNGEHEYEICKRPAWQRHKREYDTARHLLNAHTGGVLVDCSESESVATRAGREEGGGERQEARRAKTMGARGGRSGGRNSKLEGRAQAGRDRKCRVVPDRHTSSAPWHPAGVCRVSVSVSVSPRRSRQNTRRVRATTRSHVRRRTRSANNAGESSVRPVRV